jgi:hypothetical protein
MPRDNMAYVTVKLEADELVTALNDFQNELLVLQEREAERRNTIPAAVASLAAVAFDKNPKLSRRQLLGLGKK